ncbi:MAG: PIN domain-containing protein [Thermoplasmata archaeon]
MKFVLDTSAILSGKEFSGEQELYMPPSAENEIKHGRMKRKIEYLQILGLKICSPSKSAVDKVQKYAQKTGDIERVSEADIDVLALAIDLKATILTDDYSIQNLASGLGIKYQPLCQKGITEKLTWYYRCKGCGKFFDKMYDACPICGSDMKTTRVSHKEKIKKRSEKNKKRGSLK